MSCLVNIYIYIHYYISIIFTRNLHIAVISWAWQAREADLRLRGLAQGRSDGAVLDG